MKIIVPHEGVNEIPEGYKPLLNKEGKLMSIIPEGSTRRDFYWAGEPEPKGKRKEIKVLCDFSLSELDFTKGETFKVSILKIGFAGGFDRYPADGTMDGDIYPCAIVEFENGKILSFDIAREIHIVGDTE